MSFRKSRLIKSTKWAFENLLETYSDDSEKCGKIRFRMRFDDGDESGELREEKGALIGFAFARFRHFQETGHHLNKLK